MKKSQHISLKKTLDTFYPNQYVNIHTLLECHNIHQTKKQQKILNSDEILDYVTRKAFSPANNGTWDVRGNDIKYVKPDKKWF